MDKSDGDIINMHPPISHIRNKQIILTRLFLCSHKNRRPITIVVSLLPCRPCICIHWPLNVFPWAPIIIDVGTHGSASRMHRFHVRDHLPGVFVSNCRRTDAGHPNYSLPRGFVINVGCAPSRVVGYLKAGATRNYLSIFQRHGIRRTLGRDWSRIVGDPSVCLSRRWHFLHVSSPAVWVSNNRGSPCTLLVWGCIFIINIAPWYSRIGRDH